MGVFLHGSMGGPYHTGTHKRNSTNSTTEEERVFGWRAQPRKAKKALQKKKGEKGCAGLGIDGMQ